MRSGCEFSACAAVHFMVSRCTIVFHSFEIAELVLGSHKCAVLLTLASSVARSCKPRLMPSRTAVGLPIAREKRVVRIRRISSKHFHTLAAVYKVGTCGFGQPEINARLRLLLTCFHTRLCRSRVSRFDECECFASGALFHNSAEKVQDAGHQCALVDCGMSHLFSTRR